MPKGKKRMKFCYKTAIKCVKPSASSTKADLSVTAR